MILESLFNIVFSIASLRVKPTASTEAPIRRNVLTGRLGILASSAICRDVPKIRGKSLMMQTRILVGDYFFEDPTTIF